MSVCPFPWSQVVTRHHRVLMTTTCAGVLPLLLLLLSATALVCRAAISSKRVVHTDAASLLFRADATQGRSLVAEAYPITYQVSRVITITASSLCPAPTSSPFSC